MPEDIELLQRWMTLPEVNRSAFEALMAECMSDADTAATMKVLNVIWRETDERS